MTRPVGVTAVGWVAVISGVFGVALGASSLVGAWAVDPPWLPWASLAYGALCLAVARGLFRGSRLARVVATVAFAAGFVQGVVSLAVSSAPAASGALALFVPMAAALLLYTPRANSFFQQ